MFVTGDAFTESPIVKAVRADLRNSGVEIATWRSQAAQLIFVGAEKSSLRTASYDALVRAAENTMIMEVTYEVRDARGNVLAGPSRVYAERLYEYDVQGVTSSAAQLGIINRELQERLGQQIVRRLAAVDPNAVQDSQDATLSDSTP